MQLQARVVDTVAGFFALESEWNDLQERSANATIFSTFDWAAVCWKYNNWGDGCQPFILKVYDGSRLVGLAPLATRKISGGVSTQWFYPSTLQHIGMGYAWLADYLDVLSATGYEEAVVRAMFRSLKDSSRHWDNFEWHELRESSPSYQALASEAGNAGLRYLATVENVFHQITLPATWDQYLASLSAKMRASILRKTRKIERECDARFERASTPEDVDRIVALMHKFQDQRWSEEAKENRAVYMGFVREIAQAALRRGWLDLRVLTAHGEPVAATCSFRFGGTYYEYLSAMDHSEEWRKYSAGTLLVADNIRTAIEEGCHTYNMGRGDEAYKADFGSTVYRSHLVRLMHHPLLYRSFQARHVLRNIKSQVNGRKSQVLVPVLGPPTLACDLSEATRLLASGL